MRNSWIHAWTARLLEAERQTVCGLTIHVYICACVRMRVCWASLGGGRQPWSKTELFSVGRVGSVSSHLDKTEQTVNRSSWLGWCIQKEGLNPCCAERALTAHTLSGFFIGTQATAQSSALNTTNGKRGNGIFICLSTKGGLLLRIIH